jgi:ABC-type cobalamin/Fe3+-siderophores transport system ATPase subunit
MTSALTDKRLRKDAAAVAKEKYNTVKILLLGTAGCGKSTLLKQLVILHGDGFKD